MKVTKLLKLPEIAKGMSPNQRRIAYTKRIRLLEALLEKGGMSPKLTQRAQEYVYASEHKIRKINAAFEKARKAPQQARGKEQVVVPIFPSVDLVAVDHGSVPSAAETRRAIANSKRKKSVDWRQGFLTNFLDQDAVTRIEEMVADRLFKAVATKIDAVLAEVFKDDDSEAI